MSEERARPSPRWGRTVRARLLAWYAREKRDLPWRKTRNPYRIWVSEAMLQQTRVEAVVEAYRRFLRRFPDVRTLAASPEEEVVAYWSGLGYYRRARALREAARQVVARHGGRFPRSRAEAEALAGVGPYTAGAVLSIAYGLAEPVVDGNVTRVLARLLGLEDPLGSGRLRRAVGECAARLVSTATRVAGPREAEEAGEPGEWNQALMELGALLCTPRDPACGRCPLERSCRARQSGRERELPIPGRRPDPLDVRLEVLLIRRGEKALLVRRPRAGRMASMWELPTRQVTPRTRGALRAAPDESALWPGSFPEGLAPEMGAGPLLEVRHAITRYRIVASVLSGSPVRGRQGASRRWIPIDQGEPVALTGMARKILARIAAGGSGSIGSGAIGLGAAGSRATPVAPRRRRPRSRSGREAPR